MKRWSLALAATMLFSLTVSTLGQAPPAPGGGAAGGQGGGRGQGAAPAAGAAQGQGGAQGGGRGGGGGGGRGGGGAGGGANAAPPAPAPRGPDGRPKLAPGGKGLWGGAFSATGTDIPYQEWARGV